VTYHTVLIGAQCPHASGQLVLDLRQKQTSSGGWNIILRFLTVGLLFSIIYWMGVLCVSSIISATSGYAQNNFITIASNCTTYMQNAKVTCHWKWFVLTLLDSNLAMFQSLEANAFDAMLSPYTFSYRMDSGTHFHSNLLQ